MLSSLENKNTSLTIIDTDGVEKEVNYSIDGTTLTIVPEPSTYAIIFGLIALSFVAYRSRKA